MSTQILDLDSLVLDSLGRVVLSDNLVDEIGSDPSFTSAGANPICSGSSNGWGCSNQTCGSSTNRFSCTNSFSCVGSQNSTTCQ